MKVATAAMFLALFNFAQGQAVAPDGHVMRTGGSKQAVAGVRIESSFSYPEFGRRLRVSGTANPSLRRTAEQIHRNFLNEANAKAKSLSGRMTGPLTSHVGTKVHFESNDLVSVQFVIYQYLGAAHGMTRFETRTFGRVGGRVRELNLSDFFGPGTDVAGLLGPKILAKAKQNEAALWVREGKVTKLGAQDLRSFAAYRGGLIFFFEPYVLGPYSSGTFEIRVPANELGPSFRRSLLNR